MLTLAQTARRVDRRAREVRRIQRRGLRSLRTADREGRCDAAAPDGAGAPIATADGELAGAGTTTTASGGVQTAAGGGSSASGDGGSDSAGGGGQEADRGGVKGEQRESEGRQRSPSFPGNLTPPLPGKGVPMFLWIAVAVLAVAFVARAWIRRKRRIDRWSYY